MAGTPYRACLFLWAGLAVGFFQASAVWGAEYTITPSIGFRETYDDNVHFQDAGDLEHLIMPELGVAARTEKLEWKAGGRADIYEYRRLNAFDSVNQRYDLSTTYQAGPQWQLGFEGEYLDDYSFHGELEETGVVADRSRRKRTHVAPFASFALTPRDTVQPSYSFDKGRYDLDRYPDYEVHGGTLAWYHALANERSRIIVSGGVSDTTYEGTIGDTEQTTYRGLAGFDHLFSETLKMTLLGGARYTESEFPVTPTAIQEEDDTGFLVDASLEWTQERYSLTAKVNRDIAQSIYGEDITRDQVTAQGTYRWTERLKSTLTATYRRSETDGVINKEEEQAYSVHPSLGYRIARNTDLLVGYTYTRQENEITNHSEDRNRVFVGLSIDWPVLLD